MARFYSEIQGARGAANRQGHAGSGIYAWAQGWYTRLTVGFHADGDTDAAHFRLGQGPSGNGGTLAFEFTDVDTVSEALASGDPKIDAIRDRIIKEIGKLNDEAPKAIERAKRRRKREERRREREEKQRREEQFAAIIEMSPTEKARLCRIHRGIELDDQGNFSEHSINLLTSKDELNLERRGDNHIYVQARVDGFKRSWQRFEFDLTEGRWVFPFEDFPEDMGIQLEPTGFGYKVVAPV